MFGPVFNRDIQNLSVDFVILKRDLQWSARHSGTLTLRVERQSAWMTKIINDGLARSGTEWFIAVHIWQQWASKG